MGSVRMMKEGPVQPGATAAGCCRLQDSVRQAVCSIPGGSCEGRPRPAAGWQTVVKGQLVSTVSLLGHAVPIAASQLFDTAQK